MAHSNREKRAAKKALRDEKKLAKYEAELDYDDDDYYDDDDDWDDEYDERPRRRRGPLGLIIALVIVFILILGGFYGMQRGYDYFLEPAEPGNTEEVVFIVPEGASNLDIVSRLGDYGLIKGGVILGIVSEYIVRDYWKREGYGYGTGDGYEIDKMFQHGEFVLTKGMSVKEISEELIRIKEYAPANSFTIPEGYNIAQVAKVLSGNHIIDESDFYDVIRNGDFSHYRFLEDCPPGYNRLEGFLYPDTYEVFTDATAYDIVDMMLARFDELFKADYYDRAEELGMSVRDIVTLGSIVEREAVVAEERPIMAGVFHNRLEQGMMLQSCATIQYILFDSTGSTKEQLLYADLEIPSPYNTYLNEGLPPGPICSPRIASIESALFPAETEYLFFVLSEKMDGSHNFSVDAEEHAKNSNAYWQAVDNLE